VLFEKPIVGEQAFELGFGIILFVNPHTRRPINLTILDYKRLLQMDKVALDKLKEMPTKQRRKARELISSKPISNFLKWVDEPRLKKIYVRVLSPRVRELLAA
jgi:hypothetical protein